MRLFILTLSVMVFGFATLAAGQGGGFFDTLRGLFQRPQRQVNQNQFRAPQQTQQNFNNQRPQQQQQQQQVQQQQQQRPQQTRQQQNNRPNSHNNNLNRPAAGRPLDTNTFSANTRPQGFRQQAAVRQPTCGLPAEDQNDRESPRCPPLSSTETYDGKKIVYTWDHPDCQKFTATQADNYCKSLGGRAVSLDDNNRADHFLGKAAQFGQRYYWTGGRLDHKCKVLTWPSGKQEGWVEGQRYWSDVGGWELPGGKSKPQPDNRNEVRDKSEPESCLGVLNNFYADGIKWHDVACHHKKPTICEI